MTKLRTLSHVALLAMLDRASLALDTRLAVTAELARRSMANSTLRAAVVAVL